MVRKRMGRPPEFADRKYLTVLLEADELERVHRRADAEGIPSSAFVRRLIQCALRRPRRRES